MPRAAPGDDGDPAHPPESPKEVGGRDDVARGRARVTSDLPSAEQRRVDAAAQDVEHVLDPGLAVGGESPQVGPPDHDGARSEGEGLDDVAAAPYAAVEQDLDLVADGVGDGRAARGSAPASRRGCCRRDWTPTARVAPRSTTRLASSTRLTPFTMKGPSH